MKLTFLGAAGTVTGSKYLVQTKRTKILVDAGLFQGQRHWREANWETPPFKLSEIKAVLITHSHIDHIGILPRFFRLGLRCPIYITAASAALARLLLPDSARLQEEEAEYREVRGKSRHHPALPLYTEEEAVAVLKLLREVQFNRKIKLATGVEATWIRMGHILGAAGIQLEAENKRVTFSGDIGRYGVPILHDPQPMRLGNLLLIESTYGDRLHDKIDPKIALGDVVRRTVKRGGVVVIPAFAVGRCQSLLYDLRELKEAKLIPDIPVIVDSPMAFDATSIYAGYPEECDPAIAKIIHAGQNPFLFSKFHFIRDKGESIRLNSLKDPMIIISASGMLSGGRILHHLKHRIGDPKNTVLFVGFQPPGGRGAWIKSGARSLRLLGSEVSIRAEICEISSLSAHADREELLKWCRSCSGRPGKVAVVHGEPSSAENFSAALKSELGWKSFVAKYLETVTI